VGFLWGGDLPAVPGCKRAALDLMSCQSGVMAVRQVCEALFGSHGLQEPGLLSHLAHCINRHAVLYCRRS
jgi:hypothetical protein